MMHGWGWNTGIGGWFPGGGVFTLLLLVALIIGGVYLFRHLPKQEGEDESRKAKLSAEEELKKRYAKGEIDKDTYQRIKNDLEDKA